MGLRGCPQPPLDLQLSSLIAPPRAGHKAHYLLDIWIVSHHECPESSLGVRDKPTETGRLAPALFPLKSPGMVCFILLATKKNRKVSFHHLWAEFTFHLYVGGYSAYSVGQLKKPSPTQPGIWLRPHISHLIVTIPEPKGSRKTRYGTSIVAPRSTKSKRDSIWPVTTVRKPWGRDLNVGLFYHTSWFT